MSDIKKKSAPILGIVFVVVLIIGSVFFTVDQKEFVVVTQFGRVVKSITDPGLFLKLPIPIQSLQRFDNRLKIFTPAVSEYLTKDKKNIVVELFVTYRIKDPVVYLKTLNTVERTQQRLNDVLSSEVGVALGRYDLEKLVNIIPEDLKLEEMVAQVKEITVRKLEEFGISIADLRVKMLNFPEKNQQSVFQRMRAEREKIARLYRSEGTEESAKIRAIADKEKSILLSQAYEKSERIKGEGDAKAIKIYADAFRQDPRFYEFTRTLQAYDKVLDEKTTLIIPSNSDFLKYLEGPGKR
ncbi:MAG: protease modulator HflC [Rectinemataceae bacterium]|nr:protease modulator HflC [Rectinemataceae bacterium]